MLNLSVKKMKLIAKNRSIRGYKRMFEDELTSWINESRLIKTTITKTTITTTKTKLSKT